MMHIPCKCCTHGTPLLSIRTMPMYSVLSHLIYYVVNAKKESCTQLLCNQAKIAPFPHSCTSAGIPNLRRWWWRCNDDRSVPLLPFSLPPTGKNIMLTVVFFLFEKMNTRYYSWSSSLANSLTDRMSECEDCAASFRLSLCLEIFPVTATMSCCKSSMVI